MHTSLQLHLSYLASDFTGSAGEPDELKKVNANVSGDSIKGLRQLQLRRAAVKTLSGRGGH